MSGTRSAPTNPEFTYLTPKGALIVAEPGHIYFPAMTKWEQVPYRTARDEDGPWSESMADQLTRFRDGGWVVLNPDRGRIRLGVVSGLVVIRNGKITPCFGRFDGSHPRRPNELTPFAAAQHERGIMEGILSEQGEEAILVQKITHKRQNIIGYKVGRWTYKGRPLESRWVRNYARDHGYQFDPNFRVGLEPITNYPGLVHFHFGRKVYIGLPAFEPDTGSIELICLFMAYLRPDYNIFDGEILPNGDWRGTPMAFMDLEGETTEKLTDKAVVTLNFCHKTFSKR